MLKAFARALLIVVPVLAALPSAGAAQAASPCVLWSASNPAAAPAFDLRSGAAGLGAGGPVFSLDLRSLAQPGAGLLPAGAAAASWEVRWTFAGSVYYAAARVAAAQPQVVTYDAGAIVQGQEVPQGTATGSWSSGSPGTIAIAVPAAAVGAPAAGADLGRPSGVVYVVDSTGSRTLAAQGGPGADYRLGAACPAAAPLGASAPAGRASAGSSSAGGAATAAEADAAGLVSLGELEVPAAARSYPLVPFPIVGNRAYYMYDASGGFETWMLEYDLSSSVPRLVANVDTGAQLLGFGTGKDMRAIDPEDGVGLTLNWGPTGSQIVPIDLKTLKAGAAWDLSVAAPGFIAAGITYSSADRRAYLVGDMSGSQDVQVGLPDPVENAAVVSFDPATQTVDWLKVLTGCPKVLNTFGGGTLIARSQLQPALYFACWQGSAGGSAGQFPGSADVLRLWIQPGAGQQQALAFKSDVFPISGQYVTAFVTGTATFDYGSERFFLVSQSQATPGAWVLDGLTSSWAGFVSSPNPCDAYAAVDSSRGTLLLAADENRAASVDNALACSDRLEGWVLNSDGRELPPPQGVLTQRYVSGQVVVDSPSHRFFLPVDEIPAAVKLPTQTDRHFHVLVVQDVSAPPPSLQLDYDSLTSDVPEGPGTTSDFAGDAHAFGARALMVGGIGAAFSNATCGDFTVCGIGGIESGDRGLYVARAAGLDLRPVGAAAAGQSLQPDTLTANDIQTQSQQALSWPWDQVSCLDAGGGEVSQAQDGPGSDSATAACDLAHHSVSLSSAAAAADPGAGVTIAGGSVSSRVWVDPKLGTLTDTVAVAQGVVLAGPAGEVRIGKVVSEARTGAHGRSGTAFAKLTQQFDDVTVLDGSGNVVLACQALGAGACDPSSVAAAMNSALEGVMHVTLPAAAITATPHGAFAEVRKSDTDFFNDETVNDDTSYEVPALEVVVFNDGQERSRLLLQLAGVQASSIYEVHAPEAAAAVAIPVLGGLLDKLPPPAGPLSASATSKRLLVRTIRHFTEALGILFRSPREALAFLLFWALFAAAGYAAWRRWELGRIIAKGAAR